MSSAGKEKTNDNRQLNEEIVQQAQLKFGYIYQKLKDPKYTAKKLLEDFLNCDHAHNRPIVTAMTESYQDYNPENLRAELLQTFPTATNIRLKTINGWPMLQYDLPTGTMLVRKDIDTSDTGDTSDTSDIPVRSAGSSRSAERSRDSYRRILYLLRSADYYLSKSERQLSDVERSVILNERFNEMVLYPKNANKLYIYTVTKPIKNCLHYCSRSQLSILNYLGLFCGYSYIRRFDGGLDVGERFLGSKDSTWWRKLGLSLVSFVADDAPELIASQKVLSGLKLVMTTDIEDVLEAQN